MDWKQYEKEIHAYFLSMYPEAIITYDTELVGRFSKIKRQIDVLIEDDVAGYPIRLVVDTKYFSKKIDVKCVESFISMIEDVDVHQGLLITSKGFSEAAINRAYYGHQKIELDIINFDDLLRHQAIEAVPYSGNKCFLLSAPFGWVVDANPSENWVACLYQRGRDLDSAQASNEWMYINFWHKEEQYNTLDNLIDSQNRNIDDVYSEVNIEIKEYVKRKDNRKTKIRVVSARELPCLEVTGYIEFDDFIVFAILFTTEELKIKNIRKLEHILKYCEPSLIEFNNWKVIEDAKRRLIKIDDDTERSELLRKIAVWYSEMGEHEKALKYHRLSMEAFPQNYNNLKSLIRYELNFCNEEKATEVSKYLFGLDPKNPTVLQVLLEIFLDLEKGVLLESTLKELTNQYQEYSEELGNIFFHSALLKNELGDFDRAIELMKNARRCFNRVFNKDHYVFNSINKFLGENA